MSREEDELRGRVRGIVAERAGLAVSPGRLGDGDDLFKAGMGSHASVTLMLALEEEFGIEFPDEVLNKGTFSSVASIEEVISKLLADR